MDFSAFIARQDMADSVSFKGYLKRDGQEVEVRRFGIDNGAATSFLYLCNKIQSIFPSIQDKPFKLYWQDSENDVVQMDSDEEVLVALTSSNQQPFKIFIELQNIPTVGPANPLPGVTNRSDGQSHPSAICDGCNNPVVGFRYKCVTCPDFDLCRDCEHSGQHSEHFMLRMPTPISRFMHHPKFIRKMFHPSKYHKRHGWAHHAPPPPRCGDAQNGAGRCPFPQRGVTDMFDCGAIMDFIESLGVASGAERSQRASAEEPQATSSAQATASSAQATASSAQATANSAQQTAQPNPPRRGSASATQYLNNIGQMVTAILDPLGVDVTFDVRSKTAEPAPVPTPTPTTSSACPSPAATPSAATPPAATPPTTEVPSASSQTEAIPAANIETQTEPVRERRNSDDWTLLNRESPARNEASAMDIDDSAGEGSKTATPSAPSAPSLTDDKSEAERKRIQEAIETFRSMGFDFNTNNLREMLRSQNCDIFSVLEMMLNAERK